MATIPIAFVLPDLGAGGAQRVMLSLAGGLDPERFAVTLIVLGGARTFSDKVPRGIEVTNLGASRLRQGLPRLICALRRLDPRIVVSTMGYLNLGLLAIRPLLGRRIRLIIREANVLTATQSALPKWLPASLGYRFLYPIAAAIIAPTKRVGEEISRVAPGAGRRIAVICNSVTENELRKQANRLERPAGRGLALVAAGRLTGQKGFDRLIDLMPQLPADVTLTIFGDGPDRVALQSRIDRLGLQEAVRLAGFSAALPAEIAAADLFVLPSRWEGLPNVVLEALALGTPVVASDDAGVEEIATAAAPGAVTIAKVDIHFVNVIERYPRTAVRNSFPRPSLLPTQYRSETVIQKFTALVDRIISGVGTS